VILDTRLEGFKGQLDPGATFRGDGKNWHASAAYGSGFASNSGHFTIGAEYSRDDGIGDCAVVRSWCAKSWNVFTNPTPGVDGSIVWPLGAWLIAGDKLPLA
jgi:hypothetical protein